MLWSGSTSPSCWWKRFVSSLSDILNDADLVSGGTILPYKQQLIRSGIFS